METQFLGKSLRYWVELKQQIDDNGGQFPSKDRLLSEVAEMRAKLSFYESRIQEMNNFMMSNLEIKAK